MAETIGKYVLEELIAVGGMAEIYRSHTTGASGLERVLAIKRLHQQYANDRDFVEMLVDEARICIQLNHKNVCQVFDLEHIDNEYFLAMEYIDGRDLSRVIRRYSEAGEAMPLDMAVFIAQEICAGLSYAHRKNNTKGEPLGIIHRDMSPQNVLVSFEGEVKIVDFGIAKATSSSSMTQSGVIKGKFYYMSPEQARGDRIDQRADVWAVGAVLYEMLSGHMLYKGEEDAQLVGRVRRAEFHPIRELAPDIPELIEAIVKKSLARDIRLRFQNAIEMHMALATALHQLGPPYNNMMLSQQMHELFQTGSDVSSGAFDVVDPRMSRVDYRPTDDSSVYALSTGEIEYFQSGDQPIISVPQSTSPGRGFPHSEGKGGSTDPKWRPGDRAPLAADEDEDASTLLFNKGQMADFIQQAAQIDHAPPLQMPMAPRLRRAARAEIPQSLNLELPSDSARTENTSLSSAPNIWNDGWSLELIEDPSRGKPLQGLFVLALLGILLFAGAFVFGMEHWSKPDAQAATHSNKGYEIRTTPPGALIFIDGENTRIRTPTILSEIDGAHRLRLELAHHEPFSTTVDFESGGKGLYELVGRSGTLVIITRPLHAKVFINGESHGRSPVTLDNIKMPERHKVAVSHDGYQSKMEGITWEMTDSETKTVEIVLLPTFESIVSDLEDSALKAIAGTYTTESLQAQGMLPTSEKVVKKKLVTRKPSGYLFINSKPPGKIFIDDKDIGRSTPVSKLKVEAGNHKIKVYFPSLRTYSKVKTVQVRPQSEIKVMIKK